MDDKVDHLPEVGRGQPLQDVPELGGPHRLWLLVGQHQVGVQVNGDEGGGQLAEEELEHGADAVDVVHDRGVGGEVRRAPLVEQVPGA